ncbi:GNAT family N-acetyltransferase [Microbacterium sp. RD1]|uniref:GNAT family N-acetyltransferase n=1 Tax=Microbacterium sp. RD1 TaxID=3457313 RepID=UPI003FA5AABB
MADEITVTRNDALSRYEIHVNGRIGGFLEFLGRDDRAVILPHTELDPEFKGMGLGSRLAGEALADFARRGEAVSPRCPFLTHYLEGHEVPGLVVEWPERREAADSAAPAEPA